jgi:hypothetical protein
MLPFVKTTIAPAFRSSATTSRFLSCVAPLMLRSSVPLTEEHELAGPSPVWRQARRDPCQPRHGGAPSASRCQHVIVDTTGRSHWETWTTPCPASASAAAPGGAGALVSVELRSGLRSGTCRSLITAAANLRARTLVGAAVWAPGSGGRSSVWFHDIVGACLGT